MEMIVPQILHAVLEDYTLSWGGDHGVAHSAFAVVGIVFKSVSTADSRSVRVL
jgi:hypothetical protein